MEEEGQSPEYSGSFLFLIDLATNFKKCNNSREEKNIQNLVIQLEGLTLMLTGYYAKKAADSKKIEKDLRTKLIEIRDKLDRVLRDYEEEKVLKIPKDLWRDLYDYETKLRRAWKASGLQMALRSMDELEDY